MNSLRNDRDFHRGRRWILGEKQLSVVNLKYTRNLRPVLDVNTLPIASFFLWHLVYSDRLFVLSNPTWHRAHVTAE